MSNHSQQIVSKLWNYCNVLTPTFASQERTAVHVNSDPLSERRYCGTPRIANIQAKRSSTSSDDGRRATSIDRHSRVYSSTSVSIRADQLFFDNIIEAAIGDEGLRRAAAVNPGDRFELVFKNLLDTLFVERTDQNEEIFVRFMNDVTLQKLVTSWLASEAYQKLRAGTD